MKNAFYAQSGGVTSVINSSAFGLFSELKEKAPEANIYVGKNGIVGLIEDEVYDINKSKKPLESAMRKPFGMAKKLASLAFLLPMVTKFVPKANTFTTPPTTPSLEPNGILFLKLATHHS